MLHESHRPMSNIVFSLVLRKTFQIQIWVYYIHTQIYVTSLYISIHLKEIVMIFSLELLAYKFWLNPYFFIQAHGLLKTEIRKKHKTKFSLIDRSLQILVLANRECAYYLYVFSRRSDQWPIMIRSYSSFTIPSHIFIYNPYRHIHLPYLLTYSIAPCRRIDFLSHP